MHDGEIVAMKTPAGCGNVVCIHAILRGDRMKLWGWEWSNACGIVHTLLTPRGE